MVERAEQGELEFFGRIIASISHEIKNRLAIINEQAGLLEDLTRMAEQGGEVDPERLLRLANSLKDQVGKADVIIKNMNTFAHSTDHYTAPVDIDDILQLIAALSRRLADMNGVSIEVAPGAASKTINTSPFLLMNLAWLCINKAISQMDKGKIIRIGYAPGDAGASVWLDADVTGEDPESAFLGPETLNAAERLRAEMTFNSGGRLVNIALPADIDGA